jgi:hypothetical protein
MFTIFVAAVAVGVFVMFFRGERQLKLQRREASARPIAELPEDTEGRIVGITHAHGDLLTAPFSGKPCVYYAAQVERARDPGPGCIVNEAEIWEPLANETRAVAFLIADDTGRALVEPTAARVELCREPSIELDSAIELTSGQREFLARHQVTAQGVRLRYTETRIAIGEAIAVFGSGAREPDPDARPPEDYRGEQPTRLLLTSSARHPLLISNDPLTTLPVPRSRQPDRQ